jgi:hypothetical protein
VPLLLLVPLVWLGVSLSLLMAAYAVQGPGLFGKRPDGTLPWWAWPLMGPVIVFLLGLWHVVRWVSWEPCCHEVAPGVWLGRRPLPEDLPAGATMVVDMIAEMPAAAGVASGREYVCLPTLDTTAPPLEELNRLLDRLEAHKGGVYIHCAQGRGRSALVAAALLLRRGMASSPQEAVGMLKRVRAVVSLTAMQMRRLRELAGEPGA